MVDQCGMLNFFATSAVESGLPPASVAISMPGIFWMASMCLMPKAPCPAMQTFIDYSVGSRQSNPEAVFDVGTR